MQRAAPQAIISNSSGIYGHNHIIKRNQFFTNLSILDKRDQFGLRKGDIIDKDL